MDLEDLAKNYEQFFDITRGFYKNYISNPKMTYDRLLHLWTIKTQIFLIFF